jgi:hypothetical protein
MVQNLLSAGFPVIGYDIDQGKIEALTGNGFQKAAFPEALPPMAIGHSAERGVPLKLPIDEGEFDS